MRSPFPGMDPYLENPDYFSGLHNKLIAYINEQVQPRLPDNYFADLGRRVWIEVTERYIGPDVHLLHAPKSVRPFDYGNGSVATVTLPTVKPRIVQVPHDEIREPFLEIYQKQKGGKRLVTSIEVLSPSNKTGGSGGRELYRKKQRELLDANVHLIEIDLLRAGEHTTQGNRILNGGNSGEYGLQGGEIPTGEFAFAADILFYRSVLLQDGQCQASENARDVRTVAFANSALVL